MEKLSKRVLANSSNTKKLTMYFRKGKTEPSSDEQAIEEVLVRKCYRRVRSMFDVEQGEHWLDLGANIGSFAAYCFLQGATAECYEPDAKCFDILMQNVGQLPGFILHNKAVSDETSTTLELWGSPNPDNHYRGTVLEDHPSRYVSQGQVANLWAGNFVARKFDGIKMDIEGAEMAILDNWHLPKAKKLVMEYHTSRDSSVKNLARRLKFIQRHFEHLKYPHAFEAVIHAGEEEYRPRFDSLIFAWGARNV